MAMGSLYDDLHLRFGNRRRRRYQITEMIEPSRTIDLYAMEIKLNYTDSKV